MVDIEKPKQFRLHPTRFLSPGVFTIEMDIHSIAAPPREDDTAVYTWLSQWAHLINRSQNIEWDYIPPPVNNLEQINSIEELRNFMGVIDYHEDE
jgi:hypothetical protein